jgi:hypothetical protein
VFDHFFLGSECIGSELGASSQRALSSNVRVMSWLALQVVQMPEAPTTTLKPCPESGPKAFYALGFVVKLESGFKTTVVEQTNDRGAE